jgi:hypothetical protein
MIKEVTSVNILTDKGHQVYKPKKGQFEHLLKLGAHSPHRSTQGPSHGPSSTHGPSSSQGPSSSYGSPPRAPKKKGIFNFISQGVFACFNVGRHNVQEIYDNKKHVDEQLLKIEACQKEIMAKYDMPHSPLHAPMDFPPPPTFYNPWEDMGGLSMIFGAPQVDENEIEEDLGGREGSDEDEEEDIPTANTPTDEEEDNAEDDDDDNE